MLCVPHLATNIISMYQMAHSGASKRVTFTPNADEISKESTSQVTTVTMLCSTSYYCYYVVFNLFLDVLP